MSSHSVIGIALMCITLGACGGLNRRAGDCPADRAAAFLAANPEPIADRGEFLRRVPIKIRRAVFSTYPPQVKATLWQSKLDQAIEVGGLRPEQLELLQRARDAITPALYAVDGAVDGRDALLAEAAEIFERQALGAIMLVLDDVGQTPAAQQAILPIDCTCNLKDDWCAFPAPKTTHCLPGGCTILPSACGWWWSAPCNGTCRGVGPTATEGGDA